MIFEDWDADGAKLTIEVGVQAVNGSGRGNPGWCLHVLFNSTVPSPSLGTVPPVLWQ